MKTLREAAKVFYNLTIADPTVIIRTPSAEKRDAIKVAGGTLADALTLPDDKSDSAIKWEPGPSCWKDWCSEWFGPDADDDYLAKAVFALPPMAQKFKQTM